MRKIGMFLCLIFMTTLAFSQNIDLDYLRQNYEKAVEDKVLCQNMIKSSEAKKDQSIYLAYLGGLQTIWANHTFNPLAKLNTFNKGKANIEQAIQKDKENIEIRFIRLSVQKNAPFFLSYNSQVKEDEQYVRNNKHKIKSTYLLQLINKI